MSKILIKAMKPHRQRVLTEDGQEMKLQQWANKKAAAALRGAGGEASGMQFEQARNALMREAVMNPAEHGLKFLNERIPFEGQQLSEELTDPDAEGEAAAIDSQFAPEEDSQIKPFPQEKLEELGLNRVSFTPKESEEKRTETPDIFDEQGKLRETLTPQEEDEEEYEEEKPKGQTSLFDPRFTKKMFKAQKQIFHDAWTVLKQK